MDHVLYLDSLSVKLSTDGITDQFRAFIKNVNIDNGVNKDVEVKALAVVSQPSLANEKRSVKIPKAPSSDKVISHLQRVIHWTNRTPVDNLLGVLQELSVKSDSKSGDKTWLVDHPYFVSTFALHY